ncbi:group II truncated hemoglobin [Paracoccus aminophilus]|uniref:Globin n=1 Tax=Paracoccus aminophilus JCM 7686 TaxID=1367847 RepID=S5YIU6_PARAH|nr:group II truncated hemoglobin [Paracoccus aminophilus]AGT11398.1 hypothetical protein JCM7686_pAMI6p068 [Paracoccus aminophilus JCM 7686]
MRSIIDQLGGEDVLRRLVERFYDLIETRPEGRQILHLHFRGHGMSHVRGEQFDFLSGFFGGRRYYADKHGHMNLREIHDHIPIRPEDAEDWLFCMDLAMSDCQIAPALHQRLMTAFRRAALVLVNRDAGAVAE